MKNQYNRLVEKLADKELSFARRNQIGVIVESGAKEIAKPIMLGDVLEKCEFEDDINEVVELWRYCGFTKSLQQIIAASGWIVVCKGCGAKDWQTRDGFCCPDHSKARPEHNTVHLLKDSNAQALVQFLIDIFLTDEV